MWNYLPMARRSWWRQAILRRANLLAFATSLVSFLFSKIDMVLDSSLLLGSSIRRTLLLGGGSRSRTASYSTSFKELSSSLRLRLSTRIRLGLSSDNYTNPYFVFCSLHLPGPFPAVRSFDHTMEGLSSPNDSPFAMIFINFAQTNSVSGGLDSFRATCAQ